MKYTITLLADVTDRAARFHMISEDRKTTMFGECAKALAKLVMPDENTDNEVDHRYPLYLDDCDEHTLRRVKP
jgi:hypothetical protein